MRTFHSSRRFVSVILSLVIGCACGRLQAATHTWTGAGGNALWSNATNWDTNSAPTTGEGGGTIVVFGSNTTSTMDIVGLVVDLIHFTGDGNTVSGTTTLGINGTTLVVNIQSDTGTNTLEDTAPLKLTSTAVVEAVVTTGMLTLAGNISSVADSSGLSIDNGTGATGPPVITPGILVLAGESITYTGITYVNSGTLELNSDGINTAVPTDLVIGDTGATAVVRLLQALEIKSDAVVITGPNATLDLNGFDQTIGEVSGTGSVALGASGNGGLKVGDGSNFEFAGRFSGNGTVTKISADAMFLQGTNENTGLLVVAQGELNLDTPGGGATWAGALQIGTGAGAPGSASVVLKQSGQLSTATPVAVESDGVLNLNNLNTPIGALTITDGSVTLGTATLATGGLLTMTGGSISDTGAGTLSLGGDITATASATSGASITVNSVSLNAATRNLTVNSGPSQPELTINGTIADGGTIPSGLFKSGAGTLVLQDNGSNTYTGTTTIDKGTLMMNSIVGFIISGALVIGNDQDPPGSAIVRQQVLVQNDISPNSAVQINGSGELDTNGSQEIIAGVTGTGNVALTNGGSVVVDNGSVDFTFNGTLSGNGSFTKLGSDTLTMGGTNFDSSTATYSLIVGAGRLLLNNGGLSKDSVVNVTDGTTLGGTGFVGGITTTGNATLAPGGASPGTLTGNGTIDLSGGGTLALQLSDTPDQLHSELSTFGALNLTGSTLALTVTGTLSQNAYILASYQYGALTGTFGTVIGLPAGYSLNTAYSDGGQLMHVALVAQGLAVTTLGASHVLSGSATLNGTINPGGEATSYYFQYGPTPLCGSKTPVVTGLTGSAAKSVSAVLSGLNGGQTYYFQLVASNSSGPVYGGDVTLATPGPAVFTATAIPVAALSATLNGIATPEGIPATAWFEYGLTTSYGSKTAVQNIGSGNVGVTVTANLTGLAFGTIYHYRLDSTDADGTSRGEDNWFLTLSVRPPLFSALGGPASQVVAAGAPTGFAVVAVEGSPFPTDSVLTYQWYKNGLPVAGATATSYAIPSATLAQAGAYTCVVKNAAGSATSAVAQLAVVDTTPKTLSLPVGSSTTLTVNAAGNDLIYQWSKNGSGVPGATTRTLSLPTLQAADDGIYSCAVASFGGGLDSGPVIVSVYDAAPIILNPVSMPEGIVGGLYSFQIPVDTSANVAATSYTATGLPAGLTLNASTGLISGRITGQSRSYTVTLKASNARGSSSATPSPTLIVDPFPSGVAGAYNGLVDRDPLPLTTAESVNGGLGGMISMTITSAGSFSGKLTLGATTYPLAGALDATVGSETVTGSAVIPRAAPLHGVNLSFSVDGTMGFLSGSVTDNVPASVACYASTGSWNATTHPAAVAATYTAQIMIAKPALIGTGVIAANAAYPQGSGYATVTIAPAGVVTWIGKMGDGSAPTTTYTTTMDGNGNIPVHLLLDGGHGSSQGYSIAYADAVPPANNGLPLLDGALDWYKSGPASATDHTYKNGIPLFDLTVAGGQYVAPAAGIPVLSILSNTMPGMNNARLVFTDGGLTGIATTPPVIGTNATDATSLAALSFRLTPANTADFSNPGFNPAAQSLTLNAKTGAMSGGFTLVDGSVTRKVTFSGLLVPRVSVNMGVGYFLLPELPATNTSALLSGQVLLIPGP